MADTTTISTPVANLPRVAIVGRPNVGKSAIFNRLVGRPIAIVHDQPGVTRDRIAAECRRRGRPAYELTDTGGIGATLDDGFAAQVRAEADIAIDTADVILFAVDARDGITTIDEDLAQVLRRSDRPVLLIANKIDTARSDPHAAEFSSFGFGDPIPLSAAHGRNFDLLEERLDAALKPLGGPIGDESRDNDPDELRGGPCRIAIVGRPNVGKSSLVNAILNDERTIVSEVAGTTRDAVDIPYSRNDRDYVLIDTAGLRRRQQMDTSVEVFSAMRTERSIRRADICLLVIDASSGVVSGDRRIARTVLDANKPCIILLNKFDLYHPDAPYRDRIEQFREETGDDLFFLPYAPRVAVSAKDRQHLGKIFKSIEAVRLGAQNPIPTGILNRLLREAIERNPPPMKGGKRLKLLYATQKREDRPQAIPVPEYLLFVNYANLLTRTYERFLEAQIRESYPMTGLPFVFNVKSRRKPEDRNARK
ncbi:MAG: ribosome biogenesis GTPase Der [Verrucomicrobiae bacterium]|nr:ribosome biogenesis GTPase Der [Verrucomicrobiae bacterium]